MTFHDRALKEFTRARRSCSARRARVSTRAPDLEPLPARHRALDPLDGPDVLGRPEKDAFHNIFATIVSRTYLVGEIRKNMKKSTRVHIKIPVVLNFLD